MEKKDTRDRTEYKHQYHLDHKEQIREKNKKNYQENKELLCIKSKEYRQTHKDDVKEYKKNYYIRNKERIDEYKKQYHREYQVKSHGITVEEFNIMFEKQLGCCAICGIHQSDIKIQFHIDHDHITGKVRGLLCQKCNMAIGLFNDNVGIVSNAFHYLGGL